MKILVGYDGSSGSDAMFADLAAAGLPKSGDAMLLSVAEVWLPQPKSYLMADLPTTDNSKVRTVAANGAERLRAALPGWRVEHEAQSASSASLAIVKKADEWKPDLIVVGSRGRSAFTRTLLGSIAQQVLSGARCSVRVARDGRTRHTPSARLLAGVDGSADAEAALRSIASRSWPKGTEVRLVTAAGPFTITPPGLEGPHGVFVPIDPKQRDEMMAHAKAWQEAATRLLRDAGLATSSLVKDDDPKSALISEAEAFGADCIFVGSTGMTRFERFLLGSVSAAVAARAHCSVEVVRAPK